MNDTKLTINLSEQALNDMVCLFELGLHGLNPKYHRAKLINNMYDRLIDAEQNNKKKIDFLYESECEMTKNENKTLYMLYDWTDESIKLLTYDKTNIFTKTGEDVLNGEIVDNYKIIEINLDEVEK